MLKVTIWPYEQMVYAQPKIDTKKWDAQNSLGFRNTNWPYNLGQTTRPGDSQQKKKREPVDYLTLPFRLTPGQTWRKANKEIST